jgi:hypothetical protein
MNDSIRKAMAFILAVYLFCLLGAPDIGGQTRTSAPTDRMPDSASPPNGFSLPSLGENKAITEADCTAAKLGST